jgi:hypothetical protein
MTRDEAIQIIKRALWQSGIHRNPNRLSYEERAHNVDMHLSMEADAVVAAIAGLSDVLDGKAVIVDARPHAYVVTDANGCVVLWSFEQGTAQRALERYDGQTITPLYAASPYKEPTR